MVLLYKVEIDGDVKRLVDIEMPAKEIIMTVLKFNNMLIRNNLLNVRDDFRLMYLMLVFFDTELNFLEADIKRLIEDEMMLLKNKNFSFEEKINNEKSFENLYKMLLDIFQANSYGDNLFSSLVLAPLAQKFDVKWRKIVWSEYAMVLKFIKSEDSNLIYDMNDYLYPIESDESMLCSYRAALKMNYLAENSIPWKIATHHVNNANNQMSS
jgi:hypothetical protein